MTFKQGKIGVAVVGLGVGEQHARAYLATGQCQLRWLYDLDYKKVQILIDEFGTGAVAESLEVILQDPAVQVVSIASYDDAHFEQVVDALRLGKHIFVEKPLCRTIDELRVIKAAWSKYRGKLKLSSNLVLRAAPIYQYLKQRLVAGDLGEVYAFDGDYLYGRLHKITHEWRKDVENYSVMLGGGIHLMDLMLWLTGERPLTVYARGNRVCTEGTEFRYCDYVTATLQNPSGLIGRITANFGCVHRHQHVIHVFGTKGTFLYDDQGPRLHTSRNPAITATSVDLPALPASKGELIPDFVQTILNDADTRAQTQHEFDVISVCVASDQALATGKCIEVDYV